MPASRPTPRNPRALVPRLLLAPKAVMRATKSPCGTPMPSSRMVMVRSCWSMLMRILPSPWRTQGVFCVIESIGGVLDVFAIDRQWVHIHGAAEQLQDVFAHNDTLRHRAPGRLAHADTHKTSAHARIASGFPNRFATGGSSAVMSASSTHSSTGTNVVGSSCIFFWSACCFLRKVA